MGFENFPKRPDEKKQKGDWVVGARKNPDGSWDYSRAVHYTDPNDVKKLDEAAAASDQRKAAERKKRLAIPDHVKPGTPDMVSIDLDHAIFLNKETIEMAREGEKPVDDRTKRRLANLIAQYKLLKKIRNLPGNKLSDDASVSSIADDVERAIEEYEKMKAEGIENELFDFGPNDREYIPIDDVLKAAEDLSARLIHEASRANDTDLRPIESSPKSQTSPSEQVKTSYSKQEGDLRNEQEIREAELMLEVMYDGSVGVSASFPAGYSQLGSAGFSEVVDKRWTDKTDAGKSSFGKGVFEYFGFSDYDAKHKCDASGVREFIGMVPATKELYEDVDVPVQQKKFGGLFGSKTVMEKRTRKTGERPVLHSEAVANGRNEPLYKLRYAARNNSSDHGDPELQYKDDVGRSGNILMVEVLLPQSTAQKVMQELKRNPLFAREMTGELITKKMGFPEKAWGEGDLTTTGSLRPPYENWDRKTGRKFYIKEAGDDGSFNQDRVVSVK